MADPSTPHVAELEALTAEDCESIAQAIEHFVMDDSEELDEIWGPYVLKLRALAAALAGGPAPLPKPEQYWCSRCGHRWDSPLKGVVLCGDCWRRGQTVSFGVGGAPPAQEQKADE